MRDISVLSLGYDGCSDYLFDTFEKGFFKDKFYPVCLLGMRQPSEENDRYNNSIGVV